VEGYFSSEDKKQRAEAVLAALENATEDCRSEKITALITAPIDKSILRVLRPDFTGHTEYLAERAGHVRTVMMLDNTELRVALVTNHVALRDVSRSITQEILEETIRVSASGLRSYFGIERPRIAVAGLNPHAGEITKDAEEERIFQPVIKKLAADGWSVQGPFPGDSLFPKARNGKWDLLIAPYHDQGLIAAKYPGLDKVVNITLGLPYLRISPGHGVAYDIAGLNQADTRSFERALLIAEERKL
jgi:4-hydroxythreonine-4-phosphate dehydrogenase